MNIALLAQGVIAKECLKIFKNCPRENISISIVVTTDSFYQNEISDNFDNVKFIDNSVRNEDLILSAISDYNIDAIISIQHPWILSSEIIEAVEQRAFNLHNAKLPEYKGHNSISHAILNKEDMYTTTIHWLAPKVDMGDIIFEQGIKIEKNDTAYSLYQKTLQPAVNNFSKLLRYLDEGIELPSCSIEGNGKFYSKHEINSLKEIKNPLDWEEIKVKYRAFHFPPHEPAFVSVGDQKYYPQIDLLKFY
jgi:methionyl-tRNA formyltransferase